MHDDDRPVGRVLTRREILGLMGATGVLWLARCSRADSLALPDRGALAGCVVRPALTEGPYYVEEDLNRSDIRSDPGTGTLSEGAPLALAFGVSRVATAGCVPLAGAVVDVWHCDALGAYSDVADAGFDTRGQKFLRGYQVTDGDGMARFTTIYPGWYPGRAVHIHFKIRSSPEVTGGFEFTSQIFFDDDVTDAVYAGPPYAARGRRNVRNAQDGIYNQGGSSLVLDVTPSEQGYAGTFEVALQGV